MVTLAQIIITSYPNAKPIFDYIVEVDKNGNQSIVRWNVAVLGPQPTDTEIEAKRAAVEASVQKKIDYVAQKAIWEQKLAAGWTDDVTGIKLKTDIESRNSFTGEFSLTKALLEDGLVQPTDSAPFWDYNEQLHTLTLADIQGMLIRYGIAWRQMFNEFAP